MAGAKERYPDDTPDTKEAYFIRENFECQSLTGVILYFMPLLTCFEWQLTSLPRRQLQQPSAGFQGWIGDVLPIPAAVALLFTPRLMRRTESSDFNSLGIPPGTQKFS
jgi:hypothetical protein